MKKINFNKVLIIINGQTLGGVTECDIHLDHTKVIPEVSLKKKTEDGKIEEIKGQYVEFFLQED